MAVGTNGDSAGNAVTLGEGWDGTAWTIQQTADPTGAASGQLAGVACLSGSNCVAVGGSNNTPLIERWDGTTWSIRPSPTVPGGGLSGVACTGPSACMAVGTSSDSVGFPSTLAERWDGTAWTIMPSPTPPDGGGLGAVSCPSASVCIAAGAYNDSSGDVLTLAERWDGTAWTIQPTPNPAGAVQSFLNGVSCISPSACTATGETHNAAGTVHTLVERWDGAAWSLQTSPNPPGVGFASLWGVSCTSPSACLTTGTSDLGTLAEGWDGTRWRILRTPNPSGGQGTTLFGVSCSSSSACTSVGFSFSSLGAYLLAERWDGVGWTIQSTPLVIGAYDMGLPAVACPSSSTCTAVGQYTNAGTGLTLAEQWNDTTAPVEPSTQGAGLARGPVSGCDGLSLLSRLSQPALLGRPSRGGGRPGIDRLSFGCGPPRGIHGFVVRRGFR